MSNNGTHHLNFDLLENWFEQCTRLDTTNGEQLSKLVEIQQDDLISAIYQIIEDSTYHEQVCVNLNNNNNNMKLMDI